MYCPQNDGPISFPCIFIKIKQHTVLKLGIHVIFHGYPPTLPHHHPHPPIRNLPKGAHNNSRKFHSDWMNGIAAHKGENYERNMN